MTQGCVMSLTQGHISKVKGNSVHLGKLIVSVITCYSNIGLE